MFSFSRCLLALLVLLACSSASADPVRCKPGESSTQITMDIARSGKQAAPIPKAIKAIDPSRSLAYPGRNARIDACINLETERASLVRIAYKAADGRMIEIKPGPKVFVKGLREAIFGEANKLLIKALVGNGEWLWIQGFAHPTESWNFLLAASLVNIDSAGKLKFIEKEALVGSQGAGDPFNFCGVSRGEQFRSRFELEGTTLSFTGCEKQGTSGTRGFDLVVAEAAQGTVTHRYTEPQIKPEILRSTESHHNYCDKLYFKTPFGEYAVVGPILDQANPDHPPCPEDPAYLTPAQKPKATKSAYRVRLPDGNWSEAKDAEFGHFLFDRLIAE